MGTLEPRKNLINLITAYNKALILYPKLQNSILVIAGNKGWNAQKIFRQVDRLKMKQNIKLPGYVPDADLPSLYKNCRFFTYLPFYEGFGLPILEAVSFGKACLVSHTSSLPEIVGPCGMTVDPANVSQIASAIKLMWTNQQQRKLYEQKTVFWSKQFSQEKSSRKLLEILENLYPKQ